MLKNPFRRDAALAAAPPWTLLQAWQRHGELRAALYLHRGERFYVTAIQGYTEYQEPRVLPADIDDAALGEALVERLLAYDPREVPQPGYTVKDWRVLQVAKARSAKQFNAECDYVYLSTHNTALQFRASPRALAATVQCEAHVGASLVTAVATPQQIGATVRSLLRGVQLLRAGAFW